MVDFLESSYRFVHDRVHEAAYALIPTERRAAVHLRIGRMLVAHTPPGKLDEAIFEIVNQLNRASSLVTAPEEREQLAEFNLLAGKRAQASSAYVSALNYLTTGAALLTEDSWQQRRELSFALELAQGALRVRVRNDRGSRKAFAQPFHSCRHDGRARRGGLPASRSLPGNRS